LRVIDEKNIDKSIKIINFVKKTWFQKNMCNFPSRTSEAVAIGAVAVADQVVDLVVAVKDVTDEMEEGMEVVKSAVAQTGQGQTLYLSPVSTLLPRKPQVLYCLCMFCRRSRPSAVAT
jgi:hypothetical protein